MRMAAAGETGVLGEGSADPRRLQGPWRAGYLALSAAVFLFHAGSAINGRFSSDVFHHAAAIDRFAASLSGPENPLVGGDVPDPALSPYAAGLGLISRVTGVSGIDLLPWVGLVLVVVFLGLWPLAISAITDDVRSAPIALLLTLTAWGIQPWRWSGYLNLNAIGFSLGYPSVAAWVGLLGGVVVGRRLRDSGDLRLAALLGLILAFIALTHPITMVGAVPLIAATVLAEGVQRRHLAGLTITVAVSAAAVLLWPFFSPLDLSGAGGEAFDASNRGTYRLLAVRTFLALPGALILVSRAWRRPLSPLLLTATLCGAVLVAGWYSDRWTGGRALPFLLLACHVALAAWVVERLTDPKAGRRARQAVIAGLAGVCAIGLAGSAPGLAAAVPRDLLPPALRNDRRLQAEASEFDFLRPFGEDGAVIVAPDRVAARAALAYGFVAVDAPYPTPNLDALESSTRFRAVRSYLERPEERSLLIRRYAITHVLVRVGYGVDMSDHRLLSSGSGYALYGLPSAGEG